MSFTKAREKPRCLSEPYHRRIPPIVLTTFICIISIILLLDEPVEGAAAGSPFPFTSAGPDSIQTTVVKEDYVFDKVGAASALLIDPTSKGNVMFLATVSGGVWKTVNGLQDVPSWTPLTDNQDCLNIRFKFSLIWPPLCRFEML